MVFGKADVLLTGKVIGCVAVLRDLHLATTRTMNTKHGFALPDGWVDDANDGEEAIFPEFGP